MQNFTLHQIIYIEGIELDIRELLNARDFSKIFILSDENTFKHCYPKIKKSIDNHFVITIQSGEQNKNIDSLQYIWKELIDNNADRKSLLINLGGGVIGDMGGLAASLFKRGIHFINLPTTLLSQVDASVGGKLGVDFMKLKNEIGLFKNPDLVVIYPNFLETLEKRQLISGYAEMIKHALIKDANHLQDIKLVNFDNLNYNFLSNIIKNSVDIKSYFVEQDHTEQGIRKALNFGHTVGHAFESYYLNTDKHLYHGEAVAIGIICELFLSNKLLNFNLKTMLNIIDFINDIYPYQRILHDDFEPLFELIMHDKKNTSKSINCTLLKNVGEVAIDQHVSKQDFFESFTFYKQLKPE